MLLCSYNITFFDKKVGNFKFFTFLVLSNFNAVFFGQNDHLYELLMDLIKVLLFYFEKGSENFVYV